MSVLQEPPSALTSWPGDELPQCAGCGAPLDADQRFCVACGLRCAPDELRLAALPATAAAAPALGAHPAAGTRGRPFARSAAITTVIVLTLGVAIGATIGPAAVGETVAAQRPTIVLASAPALAAPLSSDDSASLDDVSATEDTSASDEPATDASATTAADTADPATGETPAATDPTDEGEDPADDGGGHEDPVSEIVPPGSKALTGVVVETDADGQGFALAARDGRLLAIHAAGCGVASGDDLHLRAHKLANGTWAADRVRRVGDAAETARVVGVVSWVDPAGGRYALAARGATLLVTIPVPPTVDPVAPAVPTDPVAPADPARTPASEPLPAVGEHVGVRLQLQPQEGDVPRGAAGARAQRPPAARPGRVADPAARARRPDRSADQQAHTLVLGLDEARPR